MMNKIAKYLIEAEIGSGGFGRVFRAFDPDVKRHVAIKVLLERDPELVRRLAVEVGTVGNLTHRNLVTLYECGEVSGAPFLVMELLQGKTLHEIIRDRVPLSVLEKIQVMTQVAEGLSYAHQRGVVHRDIKPSNIMLLPDGTVKIMDFGVARVTGDFLRTRDLVRTRRGQIFGTIPYMAPEQFEGVADERTDIFSFGTMYYELLTGRHPFANGGEDPGVIIRRIRSVDPIALTLLLPDCTPALAQLIQAALAKDSELRYQRFQDIAIDSETLLAKLKHEQAADLMAEIGGLVSAGKFDQAEAELREAIKLDPGNREAQHLWLTIREQKQAAKIRDRLSGLLKDAEDQERQQHLSEALEILQRAESLARNDPAVIALKHRIEVKLDRAIQVNRLIDEAQRANDLQKALQLLASAVKVDPEHGRARQLWNSAREEWERQAARQKAEQEFREQQELRYVAGLERAASEVRELISEGRFSEAIRAAEASEYAFDEKISRLAAQARALEREAQECLSRTLKQAESHLEQGDIDSAEFVLTNLAPRDRDDGGVRRVQQLVAREKERRSRIVPEPQKEPAVPVYVEPAVQGGRSRKVAAGIAVAAALVSLGIYAWEANVHRAVVPPPVANTSPNVAPERSDSQMGASSSISSRERAPQTAQFSSGQRSRVPSAPERRTEKNIAQPLPTLTATRVKGDAAAPDVHAPTQPEVQPAPQAARANDTQPPPAASVQPKPEENTNAQDLAAISALTSGYSKAYTGRDGNQLRTIWPDAPASRAAEWQNSASQSLQLDCPAADLQGDRASLVCQGTFLKTYDGTAQPYKEERPVRFRFQKVGGRWIITSASQ